MGRDKNKKYVFMCTPFRGEVEWKGVEEEDLYHPTGYYSDDALALNSIGILSSGANAEGVWVEGGCHHFKMVFDAPLCPRYPNQETKLLYHIHFNTREI